MKVRTSPGVTDDLQPVVEFLIGEIAFSMPPGQAEELALAIMRASSTARHEAAIAEYMSFTSQRPMQFGAVSSVITHIRNIIEKRRIQQS